MEEEIEQIAQEEVQQDIQQEQPHRNDQEHNWREANRAMAEQRNEINMLRNELSKLTNPPPREEEDEQFDPEDLVTYGKLEKIAEKKAAKIIKRELESRDVHNAEQMFLAKTPDYEDTIKQYLPDLLQENPHLEHAIKNHPRPWELAYNTVKQSWKYKSSALPKNPQAEKILKNVSRPASGNAATGSSLKGKMDNFAGLSKSEVYALSQQYIRDGGR